MKYTECSQDGAEHEYSQCKFLHPLEIYMNIGWQHELRGKPWPKRFDKPQFVKSWPVTSPLQVESVVGGYMGMIDAKVKMTNQLHRWSEVLPLLSWHLVMPEM